MLWLFLIAFVIVLVVYRLKKLNLYWKEQEVPCVESNLINNILPVLFGKPFPEQLVDDYNTFSDKRYFGVVQLFRPILLLKDPELIKQLGVKQFEHLPNHQQVVTADTDPIWSKNLVSMQGEDWRDMRATLSPSFTSSKMKNMFHVINETARNFVKTLKETQGTEIEEYEMKDTFTRYTNDVIATSAFGIECNSLKEKNNDFYRMGKQATNFRGLRALKFVIYAISPFLSKIFSVRIIDESVSKYFGSIIKNTIETREKNNIIRPDMIHLLMEARKGRVQQEEELKVDEGFSSVEEHTLSTAKKRPIDMDDIIAQAMIFFLAGFDTVSRLLMFLAYEVAVNQDVQTRLREEFLAIEGEITYEKLLGNKYLDMVVSETLRKWPPASVTDRTVAKPLTIEPVNANEKPVHLPVNSTVWFPILGLHRDSKYYPEPEKFIPERFSDENKHNINPSTYIPFGVGPRNCIGSRFALLESKILLYHILINFEIVPVKRTHIPMVLSNDDFNVSPKGGMWLGFKKLA